MRNVILFLLLLCPLFLWSQDFPIYLDRTTQLPTAGASKSSMDVQAVDVDGDFDLDIILANEFQANSILINDGNGNFTDQSQARLPQVVHDSEDIAIADFDMDNDLDIIFVSEDDIIHEYYLNNGDGIFSLAPFVFPNSVANDIITRDLNGDTFPDVIFGNAGQNTCFINQGDGNFLDETAIRLPIIIDTTQDINMADLDGDLDEDMLVGNENGNRLLVNNGSGVFTDETIGRLPQGVNMETRKVEFGDVDMDNDLDVFLSNVVFIPGKNPQNRLWINNGLGVFSDETNLRIPVDQAQTLDGIFEDVEPDGDVDIIRVDAFGNPYKCFLNNGFGVFTDESNQVFDLITNVSGLGVIMADLNGDDVSDVYICDRGGKDRFLIHDEISTAIESIQKDFAIYYNPKEQSFSFSSIRNFERLEVKVIDLNGRMFKFEIIQNTGLNSQFSIQDIWHQLSTSYYMLHLKTDYGEQLFQFQVVK